MIRILFSEPEDYYRKLGLSNLIDCDYTFDGMKKYGNINVHNYDVFVCSFYTLPHNVILTIKFNRVGKKTILVTDGIFEYSNSFFNPMVKKYDLFLYFPIIQNYLIIADKEAKSLFSSEKLKVFDYMPSRMISSENKIELPIRIKVLITTANTAYFDENQYKRILNLIIISAENLIKRNVDFSFRIFDVRLIKDIRLAVKKDILNDTKKDFEDTITNYTHIITTPSSISITSMYHNRLVLTLINSTIPINIQSSWNLSNYEDVEDVLDSFIEMDKTRCEIQKKLLAKYFSENTLNKSLLKSLNDNRDISKINYIDTSLLNMLNSKFNFNVEFYVRKLYKLIPGNKIIKILRVLLK